MKPVVFLGPTMPVSDASQILDAHYLPPARQGDLLSAVDRLRPSAIGLIDGFFLQDLSVWHKEILWALEHDIPVFGSSSMGALRAAELHAFGMVGVGWVFQQYASGSIEDDDEVVLAHGPAELGYAKLAEPLVNIRATLNAAVIQGIVAGQQADDLIAVLKSLYFPERTQKRLFVEARSILSAAAIEKLQQFFKAHYVDAKKEDAVLLLRTLAAQSQIAKQDPILPFESTVRSLCFETLLQRDRQVPAGTTSIAASQIVRHAALHTGNFEAVRTQAIHRTLSALLADILELKVSDQDLQEQRRRFCHERSLHSENALGSWLEQNHLSSSEFTELLSKLAKCQAVRSWWHATVGHRGAQAKVVLDELRLQGLYPAIVEQAVARQQLTEAPNHSPEVEEFTAESLRKTTKEFTALTGFRVSAPLHEWAGEAGFLNLADLHDELVSATMAARAGQIT